MKKLISLLFIAFLIFLPPALAFEPDTASTIMWWTDKLVILGYVLGLLFIVGGIGVAHTHNTDVALVGGVVFILLAQLLFIADQIRVAAL